MDDPASDERHHDSSTASATAPGAKRAFIGSGLLSRLSFMKPSDGSEPRKEGEDGTPPPHIPQRVVAVSQQQKTRRRRGSLRKVALLGRGAQREERNGKPLTIDTSHDDALIADSASHDAHSSATEEHDALGLKISHDNQQPGVDAYAVQNFSTSTGASLSDSRSTQDGDHDQSNSTTDEEDILQISHHPVPSRGGPSPSGGHGSYFSMDRTRSFRQTKSPLSYSGISSTTMPPPDSDLDYSETEWWGWVVLSVTWLVFIMGMGSCLEVWTWAWDVGKTPYAPPELEDDPTLPIVGYYPALIILTSVMAWVWVVVAWVGMKYFRHAKISGD